MGRARLVLALDRLEPHRLESGVHAEDVRDLALGRVGGEAFDIKGARRVRWERDGGIIWWRWLCGREEEERRRRRIESGGRERLVGWMDGYGGGVEVEALRMVRRGGWKVVGRVMGDGSGRGKEISRRVQRSERRGGQKGWWQGYCGWRCGAWEWRRRW